MPYGCQHTYQPTSSHLKGLSAAEDLRGELITRWNCQSQCNPVTIAMQVRIMMAAILLVEYRCREGCLEIGSDACFSSARGAIVCTSELDIRSQQNALIAARAQEKTERNESQLDRWRCYMLLSCLSQLQDRPSRVPQIHILPQRKERTILLGSSTPH